MFFFACSSEYVTIRFKDVGVQLEQKTLIKHVYGTVKPTQTLAIMGPSGKMQDLSYVNRKNKKLVQMMTSGNDFLKS